MKTLFTQYEKLELLALCIEGATGVIGASLILTEKHPYISITVLAAGAVATKCINFLHRKESEEKTEA